MKDQNYPDDGLYKAKEISSPSSTGKTDRIKELFRDCPDFVLRKFLLPHGKTGYCLFLETLVNQKDVHHHLIKPLLVMEPTEVSVAKFHHQLALGVLIHHPSAEVLANAISSGSVILMLEGEESVLSVLLKSPFRNLPEK